MTRKNALGLIAGYQSIAANSDKPVTGVLVGIVRRLSEDADDDKVQRWLGFCQGVMYAAGVFSLEQLKNHSRHLFIKEG